MYPAQQNATDQTANFFWVLCMIVGAGLLLWFFERTYIVTPIYWLRLQEIKGLLYVLNAWNNIAGLFHLPSSDLAFLHNAKSFLLTSDPATIDFARFSVVNTYIGKWMRYPTMVILLIMSATVFIHGGNNKFRHIFSMESLKKTERGNWPQIEPVVNLDLVKQDIEKGPWAMAKTPLDFSREHEVAHVTEVDGRRVWSIDKSKAQQLFTMQLGPVWKKGEGLPIYVKALVVIFITRAMNKREEAKKFLAQISRSASSGKLDFEGVEEAFQKYKHSKLLRWLEVRHAYLYSLMSTLLEIARTDGVLATSEFLWLKPVDRRLWYVLNGVGRQTAFVEVSGPHAHWLAEKKVGMALKTPMVATAVTALDVSLRDTLYIADEDKWHTYKEA